MMVTGVVGDIYQPSIRKVLDTVINGPDGLRSRGEIDRLSIMEETPSRSYLFLNMDDIAFRFHRPTVTSTGEVIPNDLDHMATLVEANIENGTSNGTAVASQSNSRRDGKTDRKNLPERVLYDTHRKVPIFSGGIMVAGAGASANGQPTGPGAVAAAAALGSADRQIVTNVKELLDAKVRRCVRCGSVSDEEGGYQRTWPRLSVHLVAKCVCEGAYVLEEVREGLCLDE